MLLPVMVINWLVCVNDKFSKSFRLYLGEDYV